jgi:hypothetical protein
LWRDKDKFLAELSFNFFSLPSGNVGCVIHLSGFSIAGESYRFF